MDNLNFSAINKKFVFLLMALFYGIVEAQCIAYTGQAMNPEKRIALMETLLWVMIS